MVIGKTTSSISKTEIFTKYSEIQVLTAAFPEITEVPCRISSPFRVDNNPSFSIYLNNDNHIMFKDFGDTDCRGSLLDLLCKKWNCSFNQVFDKILELMQGSVQDDSVILKPKQIKVLTRKESSELTKIQVAVRPWRDYDIEYWKQYGVELQWLKYAEVYPISHKIIYKKVLADDGSPIIKKYIFPADKYAYCYVERKDNKLSLKIYSPFSKNHKWCSKMDASVISLWTKVPEFGDKIIIASSVKDALTISCNLHIPAIAPQGEGYNLSNSAVSELKRRYKKVFISYDGDLAGIDDAKKLSKFTGFSIIHCPILDTPSQDREEVKKLMKEAKKFYSIILHLQEELGKLTAQNYTLEQENNFLKEQLKNID